MRSTEVAQIFFFGGAALGIAGLVCGFLAVTRLGNFIRVIRPPARKLAAATPGMRTAFELTVTGVEEGPVLAPFSERQCLWCSYTIWERRGKRRALTGGERFDRTLLATDANGQVVRVGTARMEMDLPFELVKGGGVRWLKERGLAQGVITYSFREARIELNDPIIVVGDLSISPTGQPQLIAQKTLDVLVQRGTRGSIIRKQVALSLGSLLILVGLGSVWQAVRKKDTSSSRTTPAITTPAKTAPRPAPTTRAAPTSAPVKKR